MTTLMLYVGIAVTFLTVWGVVMTGSYLLGRDTGSPPPPVAVDWVTETSADADGARLG